MEGVGRAAAGAVAAALAVGATYVAAAYGPWGLRAEYRRRAADALRDAGGPPGEVVTGADLARLPPAVAAYVRRSGAVGRPHVRAFRAVVRGRIRSGPSAPWMPFTGEQVNTFGERPCRVFRMTARMRGVPVDVLHVHDGRHATMRVRLASLVPVADAAGPEMDQAEAVTLLNDLCVLAPAALVDQDVAWEDLDTHHVRMTWTVASHRVSAVLVLDDAADLVDVESGDRLRASPDGRTFERQAWSTPLAGYRWFGGRRLAGEGEARWHPPEGGFTYIELHVDDVTWVPA